MCKRHLAVIDFNRGNLNRGKILAVSRIPRNSAANYSCAPQTPNLPEDLWVLRSSNQRYFFFGGGGGTSLK